MLNSSECSSNRLNEKEENLGNRKLEKFCRKQCLQDSFLMKCHFYDFLTNFSKNEQPTNVFPWESQVHYQQYLFKETLSVLVGKRLYLEVTSGFIIYNLLMLCGTSASLPLPYQSAQWLKGEISIAIVARCMRIWALYVRSENFTSDPRR